MLLGLRTVIYHAPDLAAARRWYATAFGIEPYFEQPFYVGFNVGGFELGLDPDVSKVTVGNNAVVYWGVRNIHDAMMRMRDIGAPVQQDVTEVGDGIKVASIADPFGNVIGLIENPHYHATPAS